MKKGLLSILVVLLLVACSTPKEPVVAREVEFRTVDIPNKYLKECPASVPPSKEDYLNGDDRAKKSMLINYSKELLVDLKKCNAKINAIKSINDKVKVLDKENGPNTKHN